MKTKCRIMFSLLIIGFFVFYTTCISLIDNTTKSIKYTYWIGIKYNKFVKLIGLRPYKNGYITFKSTAKKGYLTKRIIGIPGDLISIKNKEFFINNNFIGEAVNNYELNSTGLIPIYSYFVEGDHKNSMDSRYKIIGLVHEEDISHIAFPVW